MGTGAKVQRQAAELREASAAKRAAGLTMRVGFHDREYHRRALAAIEAVPADTRSLTAVMFGDPLPGRSALDRRSMADAE